MRHHRRRGTPFYLVWFGLSALSWGLVIATGYGLMGIAIYLLDR
jgi:hypothetical protein